ncbi:MAG TPA: crossover junction endodeoxyribonuclease RuvC [Candidatus Glassbacteria bacterium]|nr:crossover junction endodeoxyribonuclease RuvC [Candidatus Glassbacteria bacterium]
MVVKILGLDISSTCIGWGLLLIDNENKISYINSGVLKPPKADDIIERIVKTRDMLISIIKECNPDEIAIEDIVQFMSGKSTAKTIITLTTFNRMVCLLSRDLLQKSPKLYNVMTIRHGLKKNKLLPKKEDMPNLVSEHLGFTFNYELNRRGNNKPENYDRADGIAVALYHAFVITNKLKKK